MPPPLPPGRYVIVNVRSQNYAALNMGRDGEPVIATTNGPGVVRASYEWEVTRHDNDRYCFENGHYSKMYAWIRHAASRNDGVQASSFFGRGVMWMVHPVPGRPRHYNIFSVGDPQRFWTLEDDEINTPITFSPTGSNLRAQWEFRRVSSPPPAPGPDILCGHVGTVVRRLWALLWSMQSAGRGNGALLLEDDSENGSW